MQYYDFKENMLLSTYDNRELETASYIRVVHVAIKSFDTDLYINDKLIVPNFKYREFTDYIKLPPGIYNIKVYPKNTKTTPLVDFNFTLSPSTITTYALYSQNRKHSLFSLSENELPVPTKEKTKIRIANLIENMPPIDVYLTNGTLLYKNVKFKDITKYIELMPDTYTIDIKLADSNTSMLYVPNINLSGNNYHTLYLIGLINDYYNPQMLIPLDGISYLKF